MVSNCVKATAFGAAVIAASVGAQSTANAVIIGHGDYIYEVGSISDTGSQPGLDLQLNGGTIFSIADAYAAAGSTISLASTAPGAFASLVSILRDNVEDDITISAFPQPAVSPGVVTVTDFNYSPPPTDDLQGVGAITDILLTIHQFETAFIPVVDLTDDVLINRYDVDIDVEAIPVPASLVTAMSGFGLMGVLTMRRRKRRA